MPLTTFHALQGNGSLVPNSSVQQVQSIQLSLSISNSGISVNVTADDEILNSMLINENISYAPVTQFLTSAIRPVLASFGPWAQGYGLRPTCLDIQLRITPDDDGSWSVASTITQNDRSGSATAVSHDWILQLTNGV